MDRAAHPTRSIENYRDWAACKDVHRLSGRKDQAITIFVNRLILERLDARPEHQIINVGCGDGSLLAGLDCRARIGVAPTEEERARLVAEHAGAGIDFRAGLAQSVPAENGWADRVVCNGVLSLLPSVDVAGEAISELSRVAKLGALIWLGEMIGRNFEARPKLFGSDALGAWAYRIFRFDSAYADFYRKDYVRAIDGKMLAVERPDVLRFTEAAGLELVWDGPHLYYGSEAGLLSPSRRNYLFVKRGER